MKKAKLFGKILFYTFFFAVLLLVIGMVAAKMSNKVFYLFNRATVWVMTDSMEDQIPEQSYILIRKAEPSEIKKGDVITYYSDDPTLRGHLNTHRVVEVVDGGKSFITKGDANFTDDTYPARAEAVVGVYEKNLVLLSAVGRLFQSPVGLLCIFILLAFVIVFTFASDSLKPLLKKRAKEKGTQEEK